eukprot:GAHX01001423.1.p1 GENE.GAHX01001423.1~~GAHX01001423.1.p1  ORF type:complete len:155 (-),score=31.34 GAHX01001423.1:148-585(-)
MKLITHNMLVCPRVGCDSTLPLRIKSSDMQEMSISLNEKLIESLLPKINLETLKTALYDLKLESSLKVENIPTNLTPHINRDLFREIHSKLFCLDVVTGTLECNVCGTFFPIENGIPNLKIEQKLQQKDAPLENFNELEEGIDII